MNVKKISTMSQLLRKLCVTNCTDHFADKHKTYSDPASNAGAGRNEQGILGTALGYLAVPASVARQ